MHSACSVEAAEEPASVLFLRWISSWVSVAAKWFMEPRK